MNRVGFAVADITPEVGAAIPGSFGPRMSTGVLDPLQVRACVIEGAEETVAIAGVDAVSLRFDTVEKARRRILSACGIPERNVIIAASHTHTGGPSNDVLGTDSDDNYCNLLASRIAECISTAHSRLASAEVAWASGRCEGWAFNRRFKMRGGGEETNPGKGNPDMVAPAGPTDPEVGIIAFLPAHAGTAHGRLLGAIGNFACHSTVVGGLQFSGDYPAYWQMALRELAGSEFTLVFLNGACGDINQLDFTNPNLKESGVGWAKRMGAALATETMRAIESAQFTSEAEVSTAHGSVRVGYRRPTADALAEAQRALGSDRPWDRAKWLARDVVLLDQMIGSAAGANCPVDVVRVGGAAIAAAPWQPFCKFGLDIKRGAGLHPTLIATFANGMLGYVPTPQAFEGGGYEPTLCRGSKLQPDAGDLIVAETVRLLGSLQ